MATTNSITTNYAGENAGIYVGAAIKAANTIEQGVLTVLPNIKYKENIQKLVLGDNIHDFTCDFAASGSVTLTEKVLEPKKLTVSMQLCKNDFIKHWEAESMGFGAQEHQVPPTFEEFFIGKIIEATAAKIDANIWVGSSGTDGQFDGLVTLWEADGTTNEIDALTGSIDATNVIEYLGSIYDNTPDAVMAQEDFQFVVSLKVAKSYKRALSALGFRNDYSVGEKPLDFEGIDLKVCNGAPANFIATFQKSNVFFGTGLLNDSNQVAILDMFDHDLSDNVRYKMSFTADTQYVNGGEITYYYSA